MNARWKQFFQNAFQQERPLHPLDRGMAKKYIKQRLAAVYPEIKADPAALERAYQTLNLTPTHGTEEDDDATVFEMTMP